MCFESLGAIDNPVLRFRITTIPTPSAEELAALNEFGRKSGAEAGSGRGRVVVLIVPVPKDGRVILALEPRVVPNPTHVGRRVLQVVVPRNSHVEVDPAFFTSVAPWRATVFLHDEGGPVTFEGARNTNEHTFAAPRSNIGAAAARIIFPEKRTKTVTGCTDKPHSLSVHSPAVIVRVLRAVSRAGDVFGLVPWLQSARITGHAVAVPEVGELDASGPVASLGRGQFQRRGSLRRRRALRGRRQKLHHRDTGRGWSAAPVTRPVQVAPASRVVKVEHALCVLVAVSLASRLRARILTRA